MSISKKTSWLAIAALLVPTTIGLFGSSAALAAPSTNLSTFTVNGTDVLTTNSIDLDIATLTASEAGVLSADVVAVAAETVGTTVAIAGDSGLAVGPNTLTVTVTANWTEEVPNPSYQPARTEPNPSYRPAVVDDPATTEVDETAPAQGEPTITIPAQGTEYTTESRTASQTYTRTLNVLNNDNSAVITVNDEEVINAESTEVDWGITTVPVVVVPTDPNSTVRVNGTLVPLVSGVATTTATGLVTGENTVTVLVTAQNGEYDESLITVVVNQNTDTSAVLYVEDVAVADGDTVELAFGTTDPEIVVNTADEDATVVIDGGSELIPGENRVEIYVTAANGVDVQRYDLILMVDLNNDATATVYVNGIAYESGDDVPLANKTQSVIVTVETGDEEASYVVTGGTGLLQGDNDLTVVVTAPDNLTEETYNFNLLVADPDVTLKTFKFNGSTIADQGIATTWTLENALVLEATDPTSTITVDGGTYNATTGIVTLEAGQNDLVVTVTGDDLTTSADYSFTVGVYAIEVEWEGAAAPVSAIQNSTVSVPGEVENVTVTATSPFSEWLAEVEGNTSLEFGNNVITVTYTSPENVEVLKTFTVFVSPADLSATVEVNGNSVTFVGTNGTVDLEESPASATVVVETTDPRATYDIEGGNNLNVGPNTITVVVTGADGQTRTYNVIATVLPSTETEIAAKSVNGELISDDVEITEIPAGVISIDIDTTDLNANVAVTVAPTAGTFGGWATTTNGVITGSGFLTVTVVVTAEDGVTVGDPETFNILATKDFDVTSGSNPVTDTLRVGTYAKSTPSTVAAWFPQGAKLNYKWLLDGELISGASTSRLLLTPEHYGEEIQVRPVVSHTVAGVTKSYIGQALEVSKGIIPLASVPGVVGKAQLGNTLKVVTKKWTADVELSIQWYVNGEIAEAATADEFVLNELNVSAADTVKVRVTGTLEGYEDLYKDSAVFTVAPGVLKIVEKPTVAPGETGYVVGGKITVTSGLSSNEDADENIQWYRNGVAMPLEVGSEYEITPADLSKKITAVVTYEANNYSPVSYTLKTPSIKAGLLEEPDAAAIVLDGTKLVAVGGYDNTVATSSVKYIWYRNGRAVLGQNTANYTLTAKDATALISVRVTATYPGYKGTSTITGLDDYFQVD